MSAATASHLTVLTGASRGLGRAIAEQLLRRPVRQQLLCISRHSDDTLVALARESGASLMQWTLDLAAPQQAAEQVARWLHGIDAAAVDSATLINNAGALGPLRPLAEAGEAEISEALRVGLEAPMLLTAAFLRATRGWRAERKVLNISSSVGRNARASQAAYCAAKAGMDHFTRVVALEEAAASNGARLVSLAPGSIDTDMQGRLRAGDPRHFPDHSRFVQLKAEGRLATPASAAERVLRFLARADFGRQPVADVRDS